MLLRTSHSRPRLSQGLDLHHQGQVVVSQVAKPNVSKSAKHSTDNKINTNEISSEDKHFKLKMLRQSREHLVVLNKDSTLKAKANDFQFALKKTLGPRTRTNITANTSAT